MHVKDKKLAILKVWTKFFKNNPNTLPEWRVHPKSFINWSLSKYRQNYKLVIVNEDYPELLVPYNLKWVKKEDNKKK
jgi:hypothetical protein